MIERLVIENLGPIGRLEIEPRRLTLLIGEQASGKSLVAQLLYCFRGLEYQLASIYSAELVSQPDWQTKAVKKILDGLRAVPFQVFANGTASLTYTSGSTGQIWKVTLEEKKESIQLNDELTRQLGKWIEPWQADPGKLAQVIGKPDRIFIPTERLLYARLYRTQPGALFASDQPEPLRRFAALMHITPEFFPRTGANKWRDVRLRAGPETEEPATEEPAEVDELVAFLVLRQHRAVGGFAYPLGEAPYQWKWFLPVGDPGKLLPMEAAASGQTESWPFFALATTFAKKGSHAEFYFEEPEAHLHPRAQLEVMKAVGYLVNAGNPFVITTHSPFIGYVVDNMLQRYISYKGKVPEDQIGLNPDDVAAYRLRQRPEDPPEDIMDRNDTKLLNLDELEAVADELGGEFDQLLDMTE